MSLDSRERLLLAQAVYEFGNDNWDAVSDLLQSHHSLSSDKARSQLFSPVNCGIFYASLMEEHNLEITPDGNMPHAPSHLKLAQDFYQSHTSSIRSSLVLEETRFRSLVAEIDEIRAGLWDEKIRAVFQGLPAEGEGPLRRRSPDVFLEPVKTAVGGDELLITPAARENPVRSPAPSSPSPVPSSQPSTPSIKPEMLETANEESLTPFATVVPQDQEAPDPQAEEPVSDAEIESSPASIASIQQPPSKIEHELETSPDDKRAPTPDPSMHKDPKTPLQDENSPSTDQLVSPDTTEGLGLRRSTRRRSSRHSPAPPSISSGMTEDISISAPAKDVKQTRVFRSTKSRGHSSYQDEIDQSQKEIEKPMRRTRQTQPDTDRYIDKASTSTPSPRQGKRRNSEIDSPNLFLSRDPKRLREESEPFDEEGSTGRRARVGVSSIKNFRNVIGLLHGQISQHRNGNMFHNPITNTQARGYSDIVKRPMDLKTIKTRIKENIITDSSQYQRDIYLMFMNAMMFNPPHSDVYKMAEDMLAESDSNIQTFRQTEGWSSR